MRKSFLPGLKTGVFCFIASALPFPTEAVLIDFNDAASLQALPDAARFTFANNYKEDGMIFRDGVVPPDPRLATGSRAHYHLAYENLNANFLAPNFNPIQPRLLASHDESHVIQLTFEPNGSPLPFNLTSIEVLSGSLNVGVRDSFDNIAVYNNLTEGFTWNLLDANNLTRATLEGTGLENFIIDNVVFEPFAGTPTPVPSPTEPGQGPALPDDPLPGEEIHDSIEEDFSMSGEETQVCFGFTIPASLLCTENGIPEPPSLALLGIASLGLLLLLASHRHRPTTPDGS